MKIGFIGLGNMATAMIGGLLEQGVFQKSEITGSAKHAVTAEKMQAQFGIEAGTDNALVAKEADILVLAVKPVFFTEVIGEIREVVRPETLIISIAAGKSLDWISGAFGKEIKLVRCMPNTPALVGEGCTAVCVNEKVSETYTKNHVLIWQGMFC